MHATAKALGIDRLSVAERILLVEEIWDSITAQAETLEVPQSHKDELDRRLTAYEADPNAGSTWEVVKARLQKHSRKGSGLAFCYVEKPGRVGMAHLNRPTGCEWWAMPTLRNVKKVTGRQVYFLVVATLPITKACSGAGYASPLKLGVRRGNS